MDRIRSTVGFMANKVAWKYRQVLTQVIRQGGYDITTEHWIILASLRSQGQVSQIELARATYKDKANVTRLLKRLLELNLVEHTRCTEDRHHFKVSLTEEGLALLKIVTPKLKVDGTTFPCGVGDAATQTMWQGTQRRVRVLCHLW